MLHRLLLRDLDDTAARSVRATLDAEHAERLANAIRAGRILPPVLALQGVDRVHVYDGAHRIKAHALAAPLLLQTLKIDVKITGEGGPAEALALALGCNQDHGLPLSRADLQHRREIVLTAEEARVAAGAKRRSLRDLAAVIGCSHTFVGEWYADQGIELRRRKPAPPVRPAYPVQERLRFLLARGQKRLTDVDGNWWDVAEAIGRFAYIDPEEVEEIRACLDAQEPGQQLIGGGEVPTLAQLRDRLEARLTMAVRLNIETFNLDGSDENVGSWCGALDEEPRERIEAALAGVERAIAARRPTQHQPPQEIPCPDPSIPPSSLLPVAPPSAPTAVPRSEEATVSTFAAPASTFSTTQTPPASTTKTTATTELDAARAEIHRLHDALHRASAEASELRLALHRTEAQLQTAREEVATLQAKLDEALARPAPEPDLTPEDIAAVRERFEAALAKTRRDADDWDGPAGDLDHLDDDALAARYREATGRRFYAGWDRAKRIAVLQAALEGC